VAGAGDDGQPGILGETRIAHRKFAKVKNRTALGLDSPSVKTIRAQPRRAALFLRVLLLTHECRISQHRRTYRRRRVIDFGEFDRETAIDSAGSMI
jgi:hypothetical protein